MPAEERITFCRICEAHCGLVATVDGGRVEHLRPDKEHPLSRGYACPKGIAMTEVQNAPDRVLHPMRGGERVGWDEAIAEIGTRLREVRNRYGGDSIGWYMGNPGGASYSHTLWSKGFVDALGSPHYYTAGSQDVNNRFAASALMYGSPLRVPIPDLERTSFLLMVGANPFVSNGSVLSAPRVRDRLHAVVARGGRVVVVDPRRTETARAFEHVPIRPDSDAWLLLSMLHVVGRDSPLGPLTAPFSPEATAERTGVPAERCRALARDLAAAPSAAVYGRTGSCLGRFGTLVAFLLDALAAVTGNLDRPGGNVFAQPAVDIERVARPFGLASYGRRRSRVGGFPDVLGQMPAGVLADEIETLGRGQLRALIVSAGNPLVSVPDPERLRAAFGKLDLLVSIDLFANETSRHADFVLPPTTWLERDDVPVAFLPFFVRPFVQWTDAVVEPAGEAREEWRIVEALARELRIVPASVPPIRWLRRLGVSLTPQRMLDLMLRTGPARLSTARLRRHPHGLLLGESWKTGAQPPRRIRWTPPEIVAEIDRLEREPPPDDGLRLIGLRQLRRHNSWMNDVPALARGAAPPALRMHPDDASARSIADGDVVNVRSATGELDVGVFVTDEMTPGTVALPHGHLEANSNALTAAGAAALEPLAGMSHLNGVPVEVRASSRRARARARAAPRAEERSPSAARGAPPMPQSTAPTAT
jgi:formate dehydrogenase